MKVNDNFAFFNCFRYATYKINCSSMLCEFMLQVIRYIIIIYMACCTQSYDFIRLLS